MAVTIKDIAERAGVSYSTVSGTLSGVGVKNTESRRNILRLTQEIGHVPNQVAISLEKPRPYIIGLYFSTTSKMTSPFILHDVLTGICSVAGSKYNAAVKSTGMREPGTLDPSYFSGIVVLFQRSEDMEFMSEVLDKRIPMAVICRAVDVDASNVTTDETLAMERAMDYLLENGHRSIGIIEGNPGLDSSRLHHRRWRTSMTSHKLDPDALPVVGGSYRYASGCTAARQLLAFRPAALLCFNDGVAFGTRIAIMETGLRVPNSVSLMGFDNWDMLGYSDMHLTAMERNMGEIAKEGARVLLRCLDEGIINNRRIYLNNKLIIRDTIKNLNMEKRKPS